MARKLSKRAFDKLPNLNVRTGFKGENKVKGRGRFANGKLQSPVVKKKKERTFDHGIVGFGQNYYKKPRKKSTPKPKKKKVTEFTGFPGIPGFEYDEPKKTTTKSQSYSYKAQPKQIRYIQDLKRKGYLPKNTKTSGLSKKGASRLIRKGIKQRRFGDVW